MLRLGVVGYLEVQSESRAQHQKDRSAAQIDSHWHASGPGFRQPESRNPDREPTTCQVALSRGVHRGGCWARARSSGNLTFLNVKVNLQECNDRGGPGRGVRWSVKGGPGVTWGRSKPKYPSVAEHARRVPVRFGRKVNLPPYWPACR